MKLFLLRTLVAKVFAFQGFLLLIAYHKCNSAQQCPNLGQRTEQLFGIATATILKFVVQRKVMACGACAKAKARRKATLERRRAAERKKQEERIARAAAAQQKQKIAIQQSTPTVEPSAE